MSQDRLQPGDSVRLISLPTGYLSQDLPLTLNAVYTFRYYDGSCVCISTDVAGLDGHIAQTRVEKVTDGTS